MSSQLAPYLTRAVPRYTSYPTAPHFSAQVGAADYAAALEQLNPAEPISLYLHVPFCRELCWYCGCNMKLVTREAPLEQYAAMLRKEIALLRRHLPSTMKVAHLHWGGGTPTALAPDALDQIMQDVARHFDILSDAELALEADPRTLSDAMIDRIGALGFNRASFGVQEFDPQVQKAINRIQPPTMVARAVDHLRAAGVKGINFDLIYGLPFQTTSTLLKTIEICLDLQPDRIALFGYAHVPWMAKKQRLIDEDALPGSAARLEQAEKAAELLMRSGYVAIGLDHFARPADSLAQAANQGTLRRNFQGYTDDQAQTMLGLGTTSIGRTPTGYEQNIAETRAWSRSIENGVLPVARGCRLDDDDRLRAHVIEQIMCNGSVDLQKAGAQYAAHPDWYTDVSGALDAFADEGLIAFDGATLEVKALGRPVIRVIASLFDAYLPANKARHAVAV